MKKEDEPSQKEIDAQGNFFSYALGFGSPIMPTLILRGIDYFSLNTFLLSFLANYLGTLFVIVVLTTIVCLILKKESKSSILGVFAIVSPIISLLAIFVIPNEQAPIY